MEVTNHPRGYWLVDIQCQDRQKLLFDTVCTLADCGFEVHHATIDGDGQVASQEVRRAALRCLLQVPAAHQGRALLSRAAGPCRVSQRQKWNQFLCVSGFLCTAVVEPAPPAASE